MSEVAIGGGQREVGFPYKGGLLTGMGMGVVGVALAIDKELVIVTGIDLRASVIQAIGCSGCDIACSKLRG